MPPVTSTPLAPVIAHEDFLQRFGDWIKGLFNEADNLYNKLTDDEKKAAVWGSGVIAVINHNLDALPPSVVSLLQNAFPDLSLDVVHGFLDEVLQKVNAVVAETPVTLEDAIIAVQGYLKNHEGSFWEQASVAAANIFTILLSPETAFQKIVGVTEYVYQLIVKPHVAAVAASTSASVTQTVAQPQEPAATVASSPAPVDQSPAPSPLPAPEQTDINAPVNSEDAQATVYAEDLIGKVITMDGVEYTVEAEPSQIAPAPIINQGSSNIADNTPTQNEQNIQNAVATGVVDDVASNIDGTPTQDQVNAVNENADNGGAKTADELPAANENGIQGAGVSFDQALKSHSGGSLNQGNQ